MLVMGPRPGTVSSTGDFDAAHMWNFHTHAAYSMIRTGAAPRPLVPGRDITSWISSTSTNPMCGPITIHADTGEIPEVDRAGSR
jgi:hypothetical protein